MPPGVEESDEAVVAAIEFHKVMRYVVEFVDAHRTGSTGRRA
jgi:hypothetical protein